MPKIENLLTQTILILSLFFWLAAASANAATLTVTKTADTNDGACDTDCSLREAIAAAATTGDTIVFSTIFNTPKTITLTLGEIVINKSLTVQGPGANLLTVSGNNASRVFNCGIVSSRVVTLSGMKITGGSVTGEGGGVRNTATLNLTDVIVTGNTSLSANGGGVANSCCGSQLSITNSTISNNTASGSSASGGGIFNSSGSLNNVPGTVTITNSTISGNTAGSEGGGIFTNNRLIINGSTVSGNQTTGANGGGIHINATQITIDKSTISGNSSNNAGGGISIITSTGNTVGITNSTISGNTTVFGAAGINNNGGTTTLTNVTVSSNTATNVSSYNGGVSTINGTLNTRNSIFAGNNSAADPDVRGAFTSQGYNLVGIIGANASGFTGAGDQTGTVGSPLNAKLAPLGIYGGSTMTHALLKNSNPSFNSPAIDAADAANPPATDQRGVSRPQDGDNNGSSIADIGAYEVPASSSSNASTLPPAALNQSGYSVTIAQDNTQNGVTFTYCISSGQLPPGLSGINPCSSPLFETIAEFSPQAAVVISGTPTQSGTYSFTIRAFDSNGNSTETNYALTVTAPTVCTQAPSGMVGWYPGDGNANDISFIGNNAMSVNGATFAPGMVQTAFSLDGVDDYFQSPHNSQQELTTTATLDAWVFFNQKPSAAGRIMIIISKQSPGNDFDLAALTDDRFYLYIGQGINVASTTVIQTGVWYHIAGTWDATGIRIYVNGILENTNPTPNITRASGSISPLRIGEGALFGNRFFSGLIDEAEIFNRALSANEIQAIFNAGSAGKCKPGAGSGLEADVAYRPTGDGAIQSNDVVQVRRFLNTADTPNPNTNEFQRADSAPYNTKGDGMIQSNDVVQARRYLITADPVQTAGGPTAPTANRESFAAARDDGKAQAETPEGTARRLYVENAQSSAGQMVTVNIRVDSQFGDEAEYGFAVNYDPAVLTNPIVGAGNAGAAIRDCFVNPSGRLNCSVGAFPNNNPSSSNAGIGEISAGTNQILITVTFTVAANAQPGTTPVTLTNVNASNDAAQSLSINSTNGTVTITAPTAAQVTVSGRVVNHQGRGIARALILMTDSGGETRAATTNQLGYFHFADVRAGETYIFEARAKGYRFADSPKAIFIGEDYGGLNFTAAPWRFIVWQTDF